jgi:hypothetical protein
MTDEPVSYREMCEFIVKANVIQKPDGSPFTWQEIWEYSQTGEVVMIHQWYWLAQWKTNPTEENRERVNYFGEALLTLDEEQLKRFERRLGMA